MRATSHNDKKDYSDSCDGTGDIMKATKVMLQSIQQTDLHQDSHVSVLDCMEQVYPPASHADEMAKQGEHAVCLRPESSEVRRRQVGGQKDGRGTE